MSLFLMLSGFVCIYHIPVSSSFLFFLISETFFREEYNLLYFYFLFIDAVNHSVCDVE
jgi:hypothetical protein